MGIHSAIEICLSFDKNFRRNKNARKKFQIALHYGIIICQKKKKTEGNYFFFFAFKNKSLFWHLPEAELK